MPGAVIGAAIGPGDPRASLRERPLRAVQGISALVGARNAVSFHSRIRKMGKGFVKLERPLPYDVRPLWRPQLHRFQPRMTGVGVQDLSIEFPDTQYRVGRR
jgi:hypothetical protein